MRVRARVALPPDSSPDPDPEQVNVLLQTLALELLQSQPASPYGFATHWLEAKMETRMEEAKIEKACSP